ncbi:MAG: ParB/RepB/Spo0J family partition protein [Cyanobacteriota bacterium]
MGKRRTVQSFLAELPREPDTAIPLGLIVLPLSQPRRYFDSHKLNQLAASIASYGILEPLLVRPLKGKYELVAGERRYRAAQLVGLESVPVVIRSLTDEEALALSLVENLAREDLNPVEETEGILTLLGIELTLERSEVVSLLYRLENERKGKATHNVMGSSIGESIEAVFEGLGQSWPSFVSNRLPLLKLPEDILEALRSGRIAYTKARAIAKVKESSSRMDLLEEAISNSLSLSQIKERVAQLTLTSSSPSSYSSLRGRLHEIGKKARAAQVLDDPKKLKRLEKLLDQLESLVSPESSSKSS